MAARMNALDDGMEAAGVVAGVDGPGCRARPFRRRPFRPLVRAVMAAALVGLAACATVPTQGGVKQAPAAAKPEGTAKVAILLPLSGPDAGIGRAMLNAAELALFDLADARMELMPRDTAGTPQGAVQAARTAVADGASVVLGPLRAPEVAAVRQTTLAARVDLVAFTNDRRLAAPGVSVMGFVPSDQVDRVVAYARASGTTRFAVVAPQSPYGDVVVAATRDAAPRFAASVVGEARYDPNLSDLSLPAGQIAAIAPPPEAVMLAEGGERAKAIAAALAQAGVAAPTVRLLGTGLWDGGNLGTEPALVGALYAGPDPENSTDFKARYRALFGADAPRIATLAYDATAMAASIVKSRREGGVDRAALTADKGFIGVDGLFRITPDGKVERGMAVMEVGPTGDRVADPAPRSFQVLGQ